MNKSLGIAGIAEQSVGYEGMDRGFDRPCIEAAGYQFTSEFLDTVLAPGKVVHCCFTDTDRISRLLRLQL